jgi:hypothetical protein
MVVSPHQLGKEKVLKTMCKNTKKRKTLIAIYHGITHEIEGSMMNAYQQKLKGL